MNEEQSRRDALQGALAFAASIGAMVATTVASPSTAQAQTAGEVNALLTLQRAEYEAIQAYRTAEGLLAAPAMGDPMASSAPTVAAVAAHFRGQHEAHAAELGRLITAAGGTPAPSTMIYFTPPAGFNGTVGNLIRLACNKEKAAAVAYAEALKTLTSSQSSGLAAAIGGVETQHFIVLYLLAKGVIAPGPAAGTMLASLVPTAFVTTQGSVNGLNTLTDEAFVAAMS